ncbi:MAG TPA: nuclear transport factor 2 family protein [Acidimicrobiales bacterium]|nr:nuclear transport factor 2 family protein [Acidimicrobiales bacterium]
MGDPALRAADELAVQRLISTYCQRVDDGRFADVASLFANDGVFVNRGVRIGRQQLASFLEEAQAPERRGRHSCGYALVEFEADDVAHAATDFVFMGRGDDAFFVKFVGRYHDTLRRGAHGWQFVERRVAYVDPVVATP